VKGVVDWPAFSGIYNGTRAATPWLDAYALADFFLPSRPAIWTRSAPLRRHGTSKA
jgi:hypothetical protein